MLIILFILTSLFIASLYLVKFNNSNSVVAKKQDDIHLITLNNIQKSNENQDFEGTLATICDITSKTEIFTPKINNHEDELISESIKSPFKGLAPSEDNLTTECNLYIFHGTLQTVLGDDGRVRITPTISYPWRTIVRLSITWGEFNTFGTGAMIDKNHILTAAHCVYLHSRGGWADSIKVVPAADDGIEPFGHAWAINMRTYADWIDSASHQHDFAVITLDTDIGLQTGWMGIQSNDPSSSVYTGGLNIAGYPCDLDDGLNMYWNYESGANADEYNHWYYLDTEGGMSGSPVWIYDGENRYILTVHAYGKDGSGYNHGTRIDNNKWWSILNWIIADNTSIDKPDMADRGTSYAGFDTVLIGPSSSDFKVWCEIQNLGTAWTETFSVSYFASIDTCISQEDYFIGKDTIMNVLPTRSSYSNWSGTFPDYIPSGSYYIGWIIDSNNDVDEFFELNNINYISSSKLIVDKTPPINPTSCNQIKNGTENGVWQNIMNNPSFEWSGASDSVSGVAGYYYYWGPDPDGISSNFTTPPEYDPPAVNSGTYYLRVSTEDGVGNNALWTTLYVFKFDSTPPNNPSYSVQLIGSTESNVWQDSVNDPCFNWSGASDSVSGVAGYYYYWGTNPSGQSAYFTISSGYDPPEVNTGTYYLRVSTQDEVGNEASWITLYIFRFNDSLNDSPNNSNVNNSNDEDYSNNSTSETIVNDDRSIVLSLLIITVACLVIIGLPIVISRKNRLKRREFFHFDN